GQADGVGRGGVSERGPRRMVAAAQPPLRLLVSEVHDSTKAVAEEALRHRQTEMSPEDPKDPPELFIGVSLRRQAADDHEAAPGHKLFLKGLHCSRDAGEQEVRNADLLERLVAFAQPPHAIVDFRDRLLRQRKYPVVRALHVLAKPY